MEIKVDIEDLDPTCPSTFVLGCEATESDEPNYVAIIYGEDLPSRSGTFRIEFDGPIGTADALELAAHEIRRLAYAGPANRRIRKVSA